MADRTSIEWTRGNDGSAGASWNPIRAGRYKGEDAESWANGWHCEIITPGCERCYAQAQNKRLGTGLPYLRKERGNATVFLHEETLTQPLRWKRPRRIFVCSMTDLFGEWVTDEMIDRAHVTIAVGAHHDYQILTKRAERMRDYYSGDAPQRIRKIILDESPLAWMSILAATGGQGLPWPLPQIWAGVSVEDQRRADERIPVLLDTPAAVRWVSAEPLLGPIDLPVVEYDPGIVDICPGTGPIYGKKQYSIEGLDWVVIGGESGPGARPFELRWAHDIVSQCQAAKVPVFVKQIGSRPVVGGKTYTYYNGGPVDVKPRDRKGGNPDEWPAGIRVREYPQVSRG